MPIDFYKIQCQTHTKSELFGICDDEDLDKKVPAYLDSKDNHKWIATVINKNERDITFTAIDHCVFLNSLESRCDGMLKYDDCIVFVELKNKSRAVTQTEQLENTIRLANLSKDDYIVKQAYLSNKRKKVSDYLHKDKKDEFLTNTGFRLYFSSEILIK
jgi:hypothetical protein